jgi:hypothetical protein
VQNEYVSEKCEESNADVHKTTHGAHPLLSSFVEFAFAS